MGDHECRASQMMRRIGLVLMLWAFALVVADPPAHASTFDGTCPDGSTVTIDAGAGSSNFVLQVQAACDGRDGDGGVDAAGGDAVSTSSEPTGHWFQAGYVCDNGGLCASALLCGDGSPKMQYVFVETDGSRGETRNVCPGDPNIPTEAVVPPTPGEIFTAFKRVAPTEAELSVQPPGGKTLVNFETIFSTSAERFSTGRIRMGRGFSVEFTVSPRSFTWHFDEQHALSTDWPGRPWTEGENVADLITYAYPTSEDARASVTTTWGATYKLNGGPALDVDGTVDVTSPEVALEILEAKPTLVR